MYRLVAYPILMGNALDRAPGAIGRPLRDYSGQIAHKSDVVGEGRTEAIRDTGSPTLGAAAVPWGEPQGHGDCNGLSHEQGAIPCR